MLLRPNQNSQNKLCKSDNDANTPSKSVKLSILETLKCLFFVDVCSIEQVYFSSDQRFTKPVHLQGCQKDDITDEIKKTKVSTSRLEMFDLI